MIIRTGRVSKTFSDISYTSCIFILNMANYTVERLTDCIDKNFEKWFLGICIFYGLVCFFCIFMLVGMRLLFIICIPAEYTNTNNSGTKFINSDQLGNFVTLQFNKQNYLELFKNMIHSKMNSNSNTAINISNPYGAISNTNFSTAYSNTNLSNLSTNSSPVSSMTRGGNYSNPNYTFITKDYRSYNNSVNMFEPNTVNDSPSVPFTSLSSKFPLINNINKNDIN